MTPKEKAQELVNNFKLQINYKPSMYANIIQENICIKCAWVTVNEILKALSVPPIKNENSMLWKAENDYWQQVKAELTNPTN